MPPWRKLQCTGGMHFAVQNVHVKVLKWRCQLFSCYTPLSRRGVCEQHAQGSYLAVDWPRLQRAPELMQNEGTCSVVRYVSMPISRRQDCVVMFFSIIAIDINVLILQRLKALFFLIFITDRRPHSTIHRRGPSLSGCLCSYLAQSTSAYHFGTFVACLPVTSQDSTFYYFHTHRFSFVDVR